MVARLTEEFTDPRAKQRFIDNMNYNKRKKGQSVKEYMQDIKRDMKRYSDIPATIFRVNGGIVANPQREIQGVRRFIKGIRDEDGKEDPAFKKSLRYYLHDDCDKTWSKAIKAALKYEAASDTEGEGGDSDSDSDDEVETVDSKKKSKKKSSKKKVGVLALADQVHETQMRLTKVETAQERMATTQEQFSSALGAHNATLHEISAKLDLTLAHVGGNSQNAYQPRQQQQPFRFQQPRSQQQQLYLQQQQRTRPPQPFRPQSYTYQPRGGAAFKPNPAQNTWNAKTNQARQGNFGYNRRSPSTFPAATASAASAPKVASLEEAEGQDQHDEEEEEESVTMSMSHFMALTNQAGVEVPEDEMIAAVADINFG